MTSVKQPIQTFSDLDIPQGAKLIFVPDETKECRVFDDTQVEYKGQICSFDALSDELYLPHRRPRESNKPTDGEQEPVGRWRMWKYEGNCIGNLYKPEQKEVDSWKKRGWSKIVDGLVNGSAIKKQLQDIAPNEPIKENVHQLRKILMQPTFNPAKRIALLQLLDEFENKIERQSATTEQ